MAAIYGTHESSNFGGIYSGRSQSVNQMQLQYLAVKYDLLIKYSGGIFGSKMY